MVSGSNEGQAPGADSWRRWQSRRAVAWSRLLLMSIALLMLVPLARIVQLKIAPDPRLVLSVGGATSTRREIHRRGDLLDRRGRLVAGTTIGYRLFVDPQVVEDFGTIAVDLAAMIDGDAIEIDKRLHERPASRYVVVDPLLEDWQVDAVRRANLRGVGLDPRFVRHHPNLPLAAAFVGSVGFEHTGLSGMEHRFDARIRPTPGRLTYLRDADANPLWMEPEGFKPGRDGADVRLSIDLVIQEFVERRLAEVVEQVNAAGARAIVADCRTGEILAVGDVVHHRPDREDPIRDPIRATHPALARNRCATDPYEPGSTFKPFVWSTATELGLAEPDEVLPTPESVGYRTSYGRVVRDSHYYGTVSWRTVLVKSMNSGMAMVAERMAHAAMQDTIHRFGFGARTGCGLPGESPGIVTPPGKWSQYTQTSVSFGHEISVTPVQMVRAFCAFARDGTMPALRLSAVETDERGYRFARRAIPERIALLTRGVLRDVMLEGSGRKAQSTRYPMFGKSGTAQLPKVEGGGYHEDRYISSFIAGAPFDAPRIVVLCVIDDPDRSKGHWGGAIAGPVVRDVIERTLEYLGVAARGGD